LSTVLVVDDTALARESVARLLEYEGFKAIRAANGRDGWSTLYQTTPDLILLDLMMPMMDGVQFLRQLRRSTLWKDVPVIVLTGVSDENQLVKEARKLGIADLVPKASFGFDDLLARVRQHAVHHEAAAAAPAAV
jgi:DNA-binding response OmpR family regulator